MPVSHIEARHPVPHVRQSVKEALLRLQNAEGVRTNHLRTSVFLQPCSQMGEHKGCREMPVQQVVFVRKIFVEGI